MVVDLKDPIDHKPTIEELKYISKSFLLKYCRSSLSFWEHLLPEHIRNDADVQMYFICVKHPVSDGRDGDTVDLPFFVKKNCPFCKRELEKK